jgi:hypothetical protein
MSGPIFHHPLLKDLDYYWRIEPQTKHTCTLQSFWKETNGSRREWVERDPFRYMRGACSHSISGRSLSLPSFFADNNKKYAWNIALKEYRGTVKTLMISVNGECALSQAERDPTADAVPQRGERRIQPWFKGIMPTASSVMTALATISAISGPTSKLST